MSSVPCGECRLCCELPNLIVNIYPESGDTDEYESYRCAEKGLSSERFVSKDENGACVYLTPDGCGIYDWRPWACRDFDCRRWGTSFLHRYRGHPTVQLLEATGRKTTGRTKQSLATRFNHLLKAS
jgi:Fe-S-cluster containining protein